MQVKKAKGIRVAVFMSPKYREILNRIAYISQRTQRGEFEFLIKKEAEYLQGMGHKGLLTKEIK